MLPVSSTTQTFFCGFGGREYTVCEALDRLHQSGFRLADWCAPGSELFRCCERAMQWDECERWAHQVRNHAEKLGMRFHQMHSFDLFCELGEQHVHQVETLTDHAIRVGAILGVRDVVMHTIVSAPSRHDWDSCVADNTRRLRQKAELAGKYGMRIALENMLEKLYFDGRKEWRFGISNEEHIALVEAADCENVGYCFDVGHAHYMHLDPYESIMKMRDRLWALHIHDNDSFSDQHLLPYQGTIDFERFAQALADAQYQGAVTMEVLHATNGMPDCMADLTASAIYESAVHLAQRIESYQSKEGAFNGVQNG